MIRYSCRIKLTEFFDTPAEKDIIDAAERVSGETHSSIFLKLWYGSDELTVADIATFIKRHEIALETIGTNIHVGEHETWPDKSWFDIRNRKHKAEGDYRHYFLYDSPIEIVVGLIVFKQMVIQSANLKNIPKSNRTYNEPNTPHKKEGTYKVSYRRVQNGNANTRK